MIYICPANACKFEYSGPLPQSGKVACTGCGALAYAEDYLTLTQVRAILRRDPDKPIPMILHCPACGLQHIDGIDLRDPAWKNPVHRSHKCRKIHGGCGHIWRPADVPTTGVQTIETAGEHDSPRIDPRQEWMDLRAGWKAALDTGNALYNTIVRRLQPYFPPDTRDLDWDVLPSTLAGMAKQLHASSKPNWTDPCPHPTGVHETCIRAGGYYCRVCGAETDHLGD